MRKQNGITMLTLIISIIVMAILAGVVVTMVVGDSSIITESKQATADASATSIQEEVRAAWGSLEVDYWMDSAQDKNTYFSKENLNKYLGNTGVVTNLQYNPNGITKGVINVDGKDYNFAINTEGHNTISSPVAEDGTKTTYLVTFYNEDGSAVLGADEVVAGTRAEFPVNLPVPTKASTSYAEYTFDYWATEANGVTQADLNNIQANMNVYAHFNSVSICFVAGTKVLTENGLVNIEDIQVGMKVYSYNEETKKVELNEVLRTFENPAEREMAKVTINGEVIESTSGHEYYTVNRGWIDAKELVKGDVLLNSDNEEVLVEDVEVIEGHGYKLVYNLNVENNHNYYVGEENILVHNAPSPTVSHSGGSNC